MPDEGNVRAAPARRREVRPEIQALRAAAVALVLIYHLWPTSLPGGFVGVDVFFAISGFLITSHLLREIDRTGTVSLGAFWARRARRILPAALVVLLFCAVATLALVPQTYWAQFFTDIRASTAYVQNWNLASAAVDYLARENSPSTVQHYWSLSAEEQFYLVWPLLMLLGIGIARLRPAHEQRRWIAGVLITLTALSLAYSIYRTHANQASAYFITPTRAWEFGAGGLLALLPRSDGSPAGLRSVVSWVGIAAIVFTALAYSNETPFPSYFALLPVVGPLAVMWAGVPTPRWAPTRMLKLRPLQFLGDISYSVYLWHWPFIILAPFVTDRPVDDKTAVAILVLTILAAWVTKVVIEDPVRTGPLLARRRARYTFAAAAAGTAVVFAVALGGTSYVEGQVQAAERQTTAVVAQKPKCFGAAARDPGKPCENPRLRYTVVPTPIQAEKASNAPCAKLVKEAGISVCEFGTPRAKARETVALIGDSHAGHWRASMAVVARKRGWLGLSMTQTGCPLSKAVRALKEPDRSECLAWNRAMMKWLARHPEISTVFVAQLTGSGVETAPGQDPFEAEIDGYLAAWRAMPASVERIVVIRDTPKVPGGGKTLACVDKAVAAHKRADLACAVPRRGAVWRDPAAVAAARTTDERVRTIDMLDFFCDDKRCYPVVGGVLVYKDRTHITKVYGDTLGPYLGRRVDAALQSGDRVVQGAAAKRPRCFGAAARDPEQACRNPRLDRMAVPSPKRAGSAESAVCRRLPKEGILHPCEFGVGRSAARGTMVLVGDSHAGHWRGALDVVARQARWRGLSLAHTHCPLTTAIRAVPEPESSDCVRFNDALRRWLGRHPEISTVVVSQISGGRGFVASGGRSPRATAIAGYIEGWKALPDSVKHVVVLRDTPKMLPKGATLDCVARAVSAGRRPGVACARPRGAALDDDPAYVAAGQAASARVHAIDMTPFLCDRRRCFPVVGGGLVFKDMSHLTAVFAGTLGPFITRRLERFGVL